MTFLRQAPFILSLITVLALSSFLVSIQLSHAKELPRDIILYPSPGNPLVIEEGSNIVEIDLSDNLNYEKVYLVSTSTGKRIFLNFLWSENELEVFSIEGEISDGLYSIRVQLEDGEELDIPGAIWVVPREKGSMRVAFVTDIHLSKGQVSELNGRKFNSLDALSTLVDYLSIEKYDLVISGGDNVDKPGDLGMYLHLLKEIERLSLSGIPFVSAKGNHDSYEYFERVLAPPEFSLSVNNLKIVFLDTREEIGKPSMESLKFLETELNGTEKHKVVVMHHPLFNPWEVRGESDDCPLDKLYWSWNREEAESFLEILKRGGVELVLSGHCHKHSLFKCEGITFLMGTSVASSDRPEGERYSFYELTFSDKGVEIKEIEVPQKLIIIDREDAIIFHNCLEELEGEFFIRNGKDRGEYYNEEYTTIKVQEFTPLGNYIKVEGKIPMGESSLVFPTELGNPRIESVYSYPREPTTGPVEIYFEVSGPVKRVFFRKKELDEISDNLYRLRLESPMRCVNVTLEDVISRKSEFRVCLFEETKENEEGDLDPMIIVSSLVGSLIILLSSLIPSGRKRDL